MILLALVALQGAGTAFAEATDQSECTVPGCVAVSLADIEAETGVDFPDGASVEWSVRSKGFHGHRMLRFEVRIPACAPVPDTPQVLGNPQPWVSEPDPDDKPSRRAKLFEMRSLQDVRWTFGGWAAGIEAKGDSVVYGSASRR